MGKILAIDWGEKKSGLAISDESKKFSFPFALIESKNIAEINNIIKNENIERIILGRPRNMDGSLGKQAEKVEIFKKNLEKEVSVSVVYEDETGTSILAKSQMIKEGLHPKKNKDLIDKKAAQIILEGYLNEKKN